MRLLASSKLVRVGTAVLLVLLLAFSGRQLKRMLTVRPHFYDRIAFGERVQELSEPDALVVFIARRPPRPTPDIYRHRTAEGENLYCEPIDFYLSHRKGWNIDDYQATPEFVEVLRQRGARYLATYFPSVFDRQPGLKQALDAAYTPLDISSRWAIYRLDTPSKSDAPELGLGRSSTFKTPLLASGHSLWD